VEEDRVPELKASSRGHAARLATDDTAVLRIAGMGIGLRCDRPLAQIDFDPAYARFLDDGVPHVSIRCRYGDTPLAPQADAALVFDSQCLWKLYETGDSALFVLEAPDGGAGPYRIAAFDKRFTRGEITSLPGGRTGTPRTMLPDPLEYPLGEAMTVSLLGQGRGLMVHACGLVDDGRGLLFVGHSGQGKTTLARLLCDDTTPLNDDRIILRMEEGRASMYGTPWHGDHPGVDPRGAPVAGVFFIEHARSNSLTPTSGAAAVAELVSRSFPPLWDASGMDFTLGFAQEVVASTPCFRMGFVPDDGVRELVRCAI
jgi:hypothetical protein